MCLTVHSVLGFQQRTWLLISTEAYNLLEKRITKGTSATKEETDFHLYLYKCVVYVHICFIRISKEIIRGIYKKIYVRLLIKLSFRGAKKPNSCYIPDRTSCFSICPQPTKQPTQCCNHVLTLLHCSLKFHQ